MSTTDDQSTGIEAQREQRLEELYDLREELQKIADSDARYAKYAQKYLDSLREVGYNV